MIATLILGATACAASGPNVVVFCERGFPYYGANQGLSPRIVAETLNEVGVPARLADAREVAGGALDEPGVRCLVWCYGNTFPRDAVDAIARFRARGGSVVSTGAPFTHPCVADVRGGTVFWRDEGHEPFGGHDRLGSGQAGAFVPRDEAVATPAPDAPFTLLPTREGAQPGAYRAPASVGGMFAVSREGLPPEDELVPIVNVCRHGEVVGPGVAAIVHNCPQFKGAVDVWAGVHWLSDPRDPAEILMARQLLVRCALYSLRASGAVSSAKQEQTQRSEDALVTARRLPARVPVAFRPHPRERVLPRSPDVDPAETVVVHSVSADDQATRVALACLEGLVNVHKPRLYLIYSYHDERWLDWYRERGYVGEVEHLADADAVVERFRASMRGAVLVDERFLNAGTMLASVRRAMVCTPEQARRWDLPVIADLRGRWSSDADAYRWAFDTLWPRMTHDVVCSKHPLGSPQELDYLVGHRIFTFFISGTVDGADADADPAAETGFAETLFAAATPQAPVLGWWGWGDPAAGIGEYWGMTLASRYAHTTVGTEFMTNMSFHSGIPAPRSLRQAQIDRLPRPALDRSKVYVAISVLDSGNDPWYWLDRQRDVWEMPGRGRTPAGWIMGPLLADLAPGIAEWYYRNLTGRDELICALSGLGYMNVPDYGAAFDDRGAVLEEYLRLTDAYVRRMDLRTLQTYHGSWGEPTDHGARGDLGLFARSLPTLAACFPDFGRCESTTYANAVYSLPGVAGDVPVFHCLTRWAPFVYSADVASRTEDSEVAGLVDQVRKATPAERPAFISALALSWTFTPEMMDRAARELGDQYVCASPSQLAALYRQAGVR